MVIPVKIGQSNQEVKGIINTGATETIIPIGSLKKYGLLKEAILFKENDRPKANGLGGNCPIIGIVPNLSIQIGNRVL